VADAELNRAVLPSISISGDNDFERACAIRRDQEELFLKLARPSGERYFSWYLTWSYPYLSGITAREFAQRFAESARRHGATPTRARISAFNKPLVFAMCQPIHEDSNALVFSHAVSMDGTEMWYAHGYAVQECTMSKSDRLSPDRVIEIPRGAGSALGVRALKT